ncbi:MAG: hypothetical protein AAFY11_10860, partial [Cyanobacteria bacterium J06641_5]
NLGDDFIEGGAGSDFITGGGGADTIVFGSDILDDGAADIDTVIGFQFIDAFDFSAYFAAGGTLTFERIATNLLSLDLSGEDQVNVTGSAFGLNAAEVQLAELLVSDDVGLLELDFAAVEVPDTIDFGDTGSATLEISNPSGFNFEGELDLSLFISTDDDIDSESDEFNDALLASLGGEFAIEAGESITVEIDYASNSGVIAPGSYHLLAEIEGGDFASEAVAAADTNVVQAFHALALNAIQEFGETDNDLTGIGIEPTVGSRGLAIVQTSVFNAVNAFAGEFESYLGLDPGTPAAGASEAAAAAGASVAALASVLPGTEDLSGAIVAQLSNSFDLSTGETASLLAASGLGDILDAPGGAEIGAFYEPFLAIDGSDIEAPGAAPAGIDADLFEGFVFGINAATQVLDARSGDGFTGFFDGLDDPATYVPPGAFEEYVWIGEPALFPDGTSVFGPDVPFALSPGWGSLLSFTGSDILDFYEAAGIDENGDGLFLEGRPFPSVVDPTLDLSEFEAYIEGLEGDGGPDPLGGAAAVFLGGEDQEDFGVREYGALQSTDVTTVLRDTDQTEVAIFWAYDRADTFRPYGQLHQIAQEATYRDGDDSLVGDARTLALTAISLGEAAIAAWFAKYDEVQSRPDDVIAGDGQGPAIAGFDGSLETLEDPDFEPLLPSPPFPDFLSGHSTFAGAFGGTLDVLFPDATDIDVVSQELVGNGVFTTSDDSLFSAADFGQVRNFDSYLEIGFEDAISRVYGGVHVQEATDDAVLTGVEIGAFVAETFLQPVA